MKTCSKCGLEKDESEFYPHTQTKDKLQSQCNACMIVAVTDSKRQTKYGLSRKQYNEMFRKQRGCCAICGVHQSEFKKALAVDHNHSTGKNRGLLCSACNVAIGLLKEDREVLRKAMLYLQIYNQ